MFSVNRTTALRPGKPLMAFTTKRMAPRVPTARVSSRRWLTAPPPRTPVPNGAKLLTPTRLSPYFTRSSAAYSRRLSVVNCCNALAVLQDLEVRGLKIGYAPISGVRDDGVHLNQVDIDADHGIGGRCCRRAGPQRGVLRKGDGQCGEERCKSIHGCHTGPPSDRKVRSCDDSLSLVAGCQRRLPTR